MPEEEAGRVGELKQSEKPKNKAAKEFATPWKTDGMNVIGADGKGVIQFYEYEGWYIYRHEDVLPLIVKAVNAYKQRKKKQPSAAQALAYLRSASQTPARRREIARKAIAVRWAKKKKTL